MIFLTTEPRFPVFFFSLFYLILVDHGHIVWYIWGICFLYVGAYVSICWGICFCVRKHVCVCFTYSSSRIATWPWKEHAPCPLVSTSERLSVQSQVYTIASLKTLRRRVPSVPSHVHVRMWVLQMRSSARCTYYCISSTIVGAKREKVHRQIILE